MVHNNPVHSVSSTLNMMDDTVPIAIVGMSCRLPRSTSKPEDLWRMCAEQRDVWQPTPKERIAHDTFYHPDPARRGTVGLSSGLDQEFILVNFANGQTHAAATF